MSCFTIGVLILAALLLHGGAVRGQVEEAEPTPVMTRPVADEGEKAAASDEKIAIEMEPAEKAPVPPPEMKTEPPAAAEEEKPAPPTISEAEKDEGRLTEEGEEIADRDLGETEELVEEAARGAVEIPGGEEEAAAPTSAPPAETIPVEQQMILFDFKDADITHVLRLMSRKAGVNIIYGPEITGKITLSLETEIPWEKALSVILKLLNYAYVRDGNIYRVVPTEELEKEPTQTETFPLSYSTAKEVMASISQMLTPARGQIKADQRSNTLIITDVPARLDQIRRIIDRLDRRTPQVLIEARIVELSDDFEEDIGVDWIMLRDWDISVGQPPGDDQHLATFTDTWTDIDTRNVTRSFTGRDQLDSTTTAPTNTQTTNTVVSTFPTVDSGTTTTTNTGAPATTDAWTNQYVWDNRVTDAVGKGKSGSDVMTAVLNADDMALALNFLQDQTDANLISHPKIVTADSRPAEIKVVRQYPIPKFQYNDEIGRFEVSDIEYKDIGIILKVTPHVNIDKFITLDVQPEVSTQVGIVPFTGATNVDIPIIQSRTAKTQVLIRDGATLVIGGLIREDEIQVIRKVPLFGDTPFVGRYLFSNVGTNIERRNLMIFVTATELTDENKDLPWKGQTEEADDILGKVKERWWQPAPIEYGMKLGKDDEARTRADKARERLRSGQELVPGLTTEPEIDFTTKPAEEE